MKRTFDNGASRQSSSRPANAAARASIAKRAYEISQSSDTGSDEENWLRAERELAQAPPKGS